VLVGRIQVSSEYQLLDKSVSPVSGELLLHLLYWLLPVPPCVSLVLILLQGFIFIPLVDPCFCCKKELQINLLTGPHLAVVLGIGFRHPTAPSNLNTSIWLLLTRRQLSLSSGVVDTPHKHLLLNVAAVFTLGKLMNVKEDYGELSSIARYVLVMVK
jgi:hypothetical protein